MKIVERKVISGWWDKRVCDNCKKVYNPNVPNQKYCGARTKKIGCSWAMRSIREKKWRENNPGYYKEYMKMWHHENPDYVRNYMREWNKAHPGYYKKYRIINEN